jgi:hypothetical protein
MYLTQDYRDMIEIFNNNDARYLIVGAYAMTIFGYARSTFDIDIWIDKSDENIVSVLNSLEQFGVPFEIQASDLKKKYSVLQIGIEPNRIDLLNDIDGVIFESAWSDKVVHDFGGLYANVLNIQDIIKNKMATARPKDKIDVFELQKLLDVKTIKGDK